MSLGGVRIQLPKCAGHMGNRDSLRIVKDGALADLRRCRMFSAWRTVTFTQRCDTAVTLDVTHPISSGFIHLSFRFTALAIRVWH